MKKIVVKCPKCDAEYLPAEIYVPQAFFGNPKDIVKFNNGQVDDFYSGKDMDLNESYVCDYCNTKFYVKAYIKFNTSINNAEDFSNDTVTKLHKAKLFLNED